MAEPWLFADHMAAHVGITKDAVDTWIAEKAIPVPKVGRFWKFQASEIDAWVRASVASSDSQDHAELPTVGDHSYAHNNEAREGRG